MMTYQVGYDEFNPDKTTWILVGPRGTSLLYLEALSLRG